MIGAWPHRHGLEQEAIGTTGLLHQVQRVSSTIAWLLVGKPLDTQVWSLQEHRGGFFPIRDQEGGEISFIYCETSLEVFAKCRLLHPILGLRSGSFSAPTPPHPPGSSSTVPSPHFCGGSLQKKCCPQQCSASSKMQHSY